MYPPGDFVEKAYTPLVGILEKIWAIFMKNVVILIWFENDFRYDLAQFDWVQIQKMLTFHSGGIAIFVYLLSLMLTLVTTRLDDKISLYHINATLFEQSDPTVSHISK
jgi:hypothetical protein